MEIALLTIWHEGNFGAELQTYATVRMLRSLGHDVRVVDIRLSDARRRSLRGKIGGFLTWFGPACRSMRKFWRTHIPTTRRYRSIAELRACPPRGDVYMVGSDQVWNPEITRALSPVFFLDFGAETVRRVSYASSFGSDRWTAGNTEAVRRLLGRFSSLSCRETSGVALLHDVFGLQAQNVLDPTLLFNSYSELTGPLSEKPTLVYYPLGSFPELGTYAQGLARRLGLEALNANWHTCIYGTAVWNRNSIAHWVRDIAQAAFVVTPSFHGVAMCLLHHRQFAVIITQGRRATRITGLLALLGITGRVFTSFDEIDKAQPWLQAIDYAAVDARLAALRAQSVDYLKKALATQ